MSIKVRHAVRFSPATQYAMALASKLTGVSESSLISDCLAKAALAAAPQAVVDAARAAATVDAERIRAEVAIAARSTEGGYSKSPPMCPRMDPELLFMLEQIRHTYGQSKSSIHAFSIDEFLPDVVADIVAKKLIIGDADTAEAVAAMARTGNRRKRPVPKPENIQGEGSRESKRWAELLKFCEKTPRTLSPRATGKKQVPGIGLVPQGPIAKLAVARVSKGGKSAKR
jgi:hypothetical protein